MRELDVRNFSLASLTFVKSRVDCISLMVDEAIPDVRGSYIANLLLGKLSKDDAGRAYLIASSKLEKTNFATIGHHFVNDSLTQFYKGIPFSDKVLLLVSDTAP